MAQSVIHTSFAAGELSPNLFGRVDLDKYHTGAALMRNFFVDYRGGASTRTGSQLIDRTKLIIVKARLIPFIFSQGQSYVLEVGNFYIRFYFMGAHVLETAMTVVSITNTDPAVVQVVGHGYSTDDEVIISGALGMLEVNGVTYRITVVDANHFSLNTIEDIPVDSTSFGVYTGGGSVGKIYEISSPWAAEDLPLLKFTQSADVMTLTHNLYEIQNLSRTGPSNFTLAANVIGAGIDTPIGFSATPNSPGTFNYGYTVVAVSLSGEKSLPATPSVADSTPLDPLNATPVLIGLAWTAVTGADHYLVYKWGPIADSEPAGTYFGYIGTTSDAQFTDTNIAPDYTNGPPQFRNPFASPNHPGCCTYFQQRRCYGGLAQSPEEIDMSQTGNYNNFDVSLAVLDDDAIQIAIASRQVNDIKSLVPMSSGLVALTTGGAFQISGGTNQSAVTPTNITALPQASTGANDLPPIVVNYDILFVQNKGSIVRDLAYNFYLQTFYGFDRSALSNQLFFGYQLLEWAWAEEPFKLIWAVRNDGKLLSMTYVPEQEVYGWAQHDTQGTFESVCTVPENDEDATYVIVRRTIGVNQYRFIERFTSRKFIRVEDAWSVDCGVSLQLAVPGFGLSMSANATTAFLQASVGAPFDSSWIGQIIWLDIGGKMEVTTLLSPNQINCAILQPLGNQIPNTSPPRYFDIDAGDWEVGNPVSQLGGLDHLAGMDVEVLADGQSVGPLLVSSSGMIDLPSPATKIIAGLGFQAQLQTLNLDVGDPTIQGKRKKIAAVTTLYDRTRGLKIGESFSNLYAMKEQPAGSYTPPIPLLSGQQRTVINSSFNVFGQICLQQDFPLPATVLGLVPEVTLGDNQT